MRESITELEMEVFMECIEIDEQTGCHIWGGTVSPNGYGLAVAGGAPISAHRLAWELFYGEIPEGQCVCHHCDRKSCMNAEHLFLGSKKENSQDAVSKDRYCKTPAPSRKVTPEELAEMVRRFFAGETYYRIAKEMEPKRDQQLVKRHIGRYIASIQDSPEAQLAEAA